MDIPETNAPTLLHFLATITAYPNACWIYRGQADADWPLVPKAGRSHFFLPEIDKPEFDDLPPRDICRFNRWRKLAVAYNKTLPQNDFECLAFAQHYGLATRLLDWSTNPLVALFFAADSCSDTKGAVYCFSPTWHLDSSLASFGEFPEIAQYTPPPFDSRILLQSGVFTYHPKPSIPLAVGDASPELGPLRPEHGKNLVRISIEPKMKPLLKRKLDEIGVNRKALFPDLDGLSDFVNWETMRSAGQFRISPDE